MEVYQRISRTTRVARAADGELRTSIGVEEGTALRIVGHALEPSLAAGSGGNRVAIDRLLTMLPDGGGRRSKRSPSAIGERIDCEAAGEADPSELVDWLRGLPAGAAWIESAVTVECWAGPQADCFGQRVRRRTWAMARRDDGATHWTARRGEGLPDREALLPRPGRGRDGGAGGPLLLEPTAVAQLVPALVLATHRTRGRLGGPVGAGWSLLDDPTDPESLFGGVFDDELHPTRPRRLAGGGRRVATLPRRGMQRRASFRDQPAGFPANLKLDGASIDPPDRRREAQALTLHRLDPERWVLELKTPRPVFATTGPAALVEGCLGAVGPVVRTHRGVATAGLLFDPSVLRFE